MNSTGVRGSRRTIVAQICDVNGAVCGAGFLITDNLICTCTHVLTRAQNPHGGGATPKPGSSVAVTFPYLSKLTAKVTVLSASSDTDIAILQLDTPVADVHLYNTPPRNGEPFETVGFPVGNPEGAWVAGNIIGQRTDESFQLNIDDLTGYSVQPGFSGAPVWSRRSGAVLGMIRDHHPDASTTPVSFATGGQRIAWPIKVAAMVPMQQLQRHLSQHADGCEPNEPPTADPVKVLTAGLADLPRSRRDSVQQFLHQYLGTSMVPAPFGGRGGELAALDRWLADRERPFAVMAASAGQGKSTLVTRWAARLVSSGTVDVILVPISIRFDTAASPAAVSILGARLRHIEDNHADLPSDPDTWVSEITAALRRDRPPDRPLVVIIDGADEAADWALGRDLKFVEVGSGVKILLVTREVGDRGGTGWAKVMHWPWAAHFNVGLLNTEGVRQAVYSMGPALAPIADCPEVLAELTRLCQGDPLMVGQWLTTLWERAQSGQHPLTADDLHRIEPGLAGLFTDWCQHQRTQWEIAGADPELVEKRVTDFLHLCALALGPLTFEDAAEIGGKRWSSIDLRTISTYAARFITGDGRERGWVFSHPRLADFFCDYRMNIREHAAWERRFLKLGQQTLKQLKDGKPLGHKRIYALRHYGAHLTRASKNAAVLGLDADTVSLQRFTELITPAWLSAVTTLTATHDGFLSDLDRASTRAKQCIEESLNHNEHTAIGEMLAAQVRLALVRASIHSVTANVPGAVVVGLLDTGAWNPRQALAFSQRMFPDERVNVLAAVIRLAPDLTDEVLATTQTLPPTPARLRLLAAAGEQDPTRRPHLATEALTMFLPACPQLFTADAVDAILPLLDQSQLPQLVELIESLGHPQGRANALLALADTQTPQRRGQLVSSATHAAASLHDAETSCELLLRAASLSADQGQRAEALAQAHTRARTIGPADRKLVCLLQVCKQSPSAARGAVQREILAVIDSDQTTPVWANQHLCQLIQFADPVQLDELADWVDAATSPMWKRGSYAALNGAEFLCRLAERLDRPRARPISTRALTELQDCSWRSLTCDEERAAVHLLTQLPDDQQGQWQPLVDKLSELGHLERALIDDDQQPQLDFEDLTRTLTRVLCDGGAGSLERVLSYAGSLPASCLIAPLITATNVAQHRHSWHSLGRALPQLLGSAPRQGDKLEPRYSEAFLQMISAMTGPSRFAAVALLAPELSPEALQQVLDLQMRIDDTADQDQLLITLAGHMDTTGRARWATRILTRLGLPERGTEFTDYRHTADALLPLLRVEEVTQFANAIATDVAASAHRGRVLCEVLYRLCELDRADAAVALLESDEQRFLVEDLSIKVAALAVATERTQLDSAILALVGGGYSRLRRLLALPEQWRHRHRQLIEDEVARWQSAGQFDFNRRYTLELLAAAVPYISDSNAQAASMQSLLAAVAACDRPEDRIETLVVLLRQTDHPQHGAIVALAHQTFAQCTNTHYRRRLMTALATHLNPPTLTEFVLNEFAGDYMLDPVLTAMINRLDAAQVRSTYATAVAYAHTHGGVGDTLKAHAVIMTKCLIRLADLGLVDECLDLLQQPPADTSRVARVVLEAIADRIPDESLPLAHQLVNPDGGYKGHPMTTATLLLREADVTGGPLPLFQRLADPTPIYFSGTILPGLVERLLTIPARHLYHPMADVLGKCSRNEHRYLLRDLVHLTPLIAHLGGAAALEATANAVIEVGEWFA